MGQGIDLLGLVTRVVPERPPPAIDGASLRSVLIVKLSSIGDVVHALPVASAVKRTFPQIRLTWAIEEWTAPLVSGHPAVDRVVVFPTMARWPSRLAGWPAAFRSAVRALRAETYDVALDLQGLARSALVCRLSRAPVMIARSGQREGAHLVSYGLPLPRGRLHAVDEYLQVAAHVGASIGSVSFGLTASDEARRAVDRLLGDEPSAAERLIVINPSAAGGGKEWRAEHWVAVIDALAEDARVVVAGASTHAAGHAAIVDAARHRPVDITGRTSLADLIALLERAALHVAPDTGTVHIAAALGTPVVAVYGPTPPSRVGPYGQLDGVVAHRDLCGRLCPSYCLRGRRCLQAVTPREVLARARAILVAGHAAPMTR